MNKIHWCFASVCFITSGMLIGTEELKKSQNNADPVENSCLVEEKTFEPLELDMQNFFGEVDQVAHVKRSVPSAPAPAWKKRMTAVVIWVALQYERGERLAHATWSLAQNKVRDILRIF